MSGIIGNLFGKKDTPVSNPTGFQTLPQEFQQGFLDLLQQGQGIDPSMWDPQAMTGFDRQAMEHTRAGLPLIGQPASGKGFDFGKRASAAFGGVEPFIDQSFQNTMAGTTALSSGEIGSSIADFMNPFEESVIGGARRDMMRDRESQLGYARGMAGNAGAFGGTRQAALEGDIMRTSGENMGDVLGRLRAGGFDRAAGRGLNRLQTDRGRMLQGAGLNLGQAGAQQNQAGGLMGARMGMDQIRNSASNRALGFGEFNRASQQGMIQNSAAMGDFIRGRQEQRQQAPLAQMDMLMQLLGSAPTGGGGIQLRENRGLLQRIADPVGTVVGGGRGGGSGGTWLNPDLKY